MKRVFLLAVALIGITSAAYGANEKRMWAYPLVYPDTRVDRVTSVNESGQVTGGVVDPNSGAPVAFFTGPNGQGLHMLRVPGAISSVGYSINDLGQVAGSANYADGTSASFVTDPGGQNLHLLDAHGVQLDQVIKINNSGTVLAVNFATFNYYVAYSDGRAFKKVEIHGAQPGIAINSMNDREQFSGYGIQRSSLSQHAFVSGPDGKGTKWIGLDNDASAAVLTINDFGDAVGYEWKIGGGVSEAVTIKRKQTEAAVIASPVGGSVFLYTLNNRGDIGGQVIPGRRPWEPRAVVGTFGGMLTDLNSLVVNLPPGEMLTVTVGITDSKRMLVKGIYSDNYYLVCPAENCQ